MSTTPSIVSDWRPGAIDRQGDAYHVNSVTTPRRRAVRPTCADCGGRILMTPAAAARYRWRLEHLCRWCFRQRTRDEEMDEDDAHLAFVESLDDEPCICRAAHPAFSETLCPQCEAGQDEARAAIASDRGLEAIDADHRAHLLTQPEGMSLEQYGLALGRGQ